MGRRAIEHARVRGPYRHRDGWRVETIDPEADRQEGRVATDYFGSQEEAEAFKRAVEAKLARLYGVTFDDGLTQYRTWMIEKKGNQAGSATETERRLRLFFEEVIGQRLAKVNEERAGELYEAFTHRTYEVGPKKARRVKPYQPAHHRHTLAQAKTFLRWCVDQGWLKASQLENVEGHGKANVGKEQLTGDEARIYFRWCMCKAVHGNDAALGLLMCLLMRRRNGDIRKRVVRDVDLDGTVLRFGVGTSAKTKTKKGDVPDEIPECLRSLIQGRIEGRGPLEPLFPSADGGFHGSSWLRAAAHRLCAGAGVPYVPPHGLKGTAGTLAAIKLGKTGDDLAGYLFHEEVTTSERNYAAEGAVRVAVARAGMKVITGGMKS